MRSSNWIYSPYLDYMLVFLLIASSGIMFFFRNDEYVIIGFLLSGALFFARNLKIGNPIIIAVAVFFFVELLQMVVFNNFTLKTSIGTIVQLCFAYFVVKLTNSKFTDYYIKILYYLTLISFFFWLLLFVPGATNFVIKNFTPYFNPLFKVSDMHYIYSPNIIVYNYNRDHYMLYRNCGAFWESGAFAIFLMIAFIFNTYKQKKILERTNIVLGIGILTTVSTSGYLALFVFVFGYYMLSHHVRYKIVYIILVAITIIPAYMRLEFLNQKIMENVDLAESTTTSRFGSALADIKMIRERPIIGYGRKLENRYGKAQFNKKLMHRNNGITNLLTSYGIPLFILYFAWYFQSFRNLDRIYGKNIALIFLITMILLGFSQKIFNYPLFYSLLFLRVIDTPDAVTAINPLKLL